MIFEPVLILVFLAAFLIFWSLNIIYEYQRAVVFTLGRFSQVKGPGLVIVIPLIQRKVRVDLRTQVHDVPVQEAISRDNVSIKVDAVLYFRVIDAAKAFIHVQDYFSATSKLAQTTLRSVIGKHELDQMLAERDKLNTDIQDILENQVAAWGIEVINVEVRDILLTDDMIRAIARQAEAERDRRAKIIHADAEFQAAQTLTNAATILASAAGGMQLRYLQTLSEIARENNSTVIFPMPIDIVKPFLDIVEHAAATRGSGHAVTITPPSGAA
ncbi:hypothetical protein C4901_16450 [Acidiferrobacter sp. SPIII_3]|jgi:regulator of protease activity HflC (stomatin/prohibitin superfamily)|uniref:slipin family protein n=1 Tax=Acidiferrobacter sp. SPIII_3 TaxID=1281578 RepID=UPI000D73B66F|nr:slipin family protein [Acidiferrobacter sp. SPIII_3]AWP24716.1 hypothetical protein C4901_16450 [Acidiferrobacter sp. SPIII_3]